MVVWKAGDITLECVGCGHIMPYGRDLDPSIPANVVLIKTNQCSHCEDGAWAEETFYDKDGKEVVVP